VNVRAAPRLAIAAASLVRKQACRVERSNVCDGRGAAVAARLRPAEGIQGRLQQEEITIALRNYAWRFGRQVGR